MRKIIIGLLLSTAVFADMPDHLRPNPQLGADERLEAMHQIVDAIDRSIYEIQIVSAKLDALQRTNDLLLANYNMISQIAWQFDHPIVEAKAPAKKGP